MPCSAPAMHRLAASLHRFDLRWALGSKASVVARFANSSRTAAWYGRARGRSSATPLKGPDGQPGWFYVWCKGEKKNCDEKAGEVCPQGYELIDMSENSGTTFEGYKSAYVTRSYRGYMQIKCYGPQPRSQTGVTMAAKSPMTDDVSTEELQKAVDHMHGLPTRFVEVDERYEARRREGVSADRLPERCEARLCVFVHDYGQEATVHRHPGSLSGG